MIESIEIDNRRIVVKGIGKLFYQDGFPISLSITILKNKGYEISLIHVADECMKNGWSPKTTVNKLAADFEDDIDHNEFDKNSLEKFCYATYEDQREMIFNYLFNNKNQAKEWAIQHISAQTGT